MRLLLGILIGFALAVPSSSALQFRGNHCSARWEIRSHIRACKANNMVSNAEGISGPVCFDLKCRKKPDFKGRVELRRLYRLIGR